MIVKWIIGIATTIALAVALIFSQGCAAQQTTNGTHPPIITTEQAQAQAWAKAVDYFGTIETARHAGNQLALTLSRQNKIPVGVLETFVKVDKAAIAATKLLQSSPNNFSQPIATQVTLLAGQILSELSQWSTGLQGSLVAASSEELRHEILVMEVAATSAKELK